MTRSWFLVVLSIVNNAWPGAHASSFASELLADIAEKAMSPAVNGTFATSH